MLDIRPVSKVIWEGFRLLGFSCHEIRMLGRIDTALKAQDMPDGSQGSGHA